MVENCFLCIEKNTCIRVSFYNYKFLTMRVFKKTADLRDAIDSIQAAKESIGFVPTMGALHEGHASLIRRSKSENDHTIVSIFVNPTQFNNPDDLKNYPRTLTHDLILLNEYNVDIVFAPSENEIYPEPDHRNFDFAPLDKVMEGVHRPGHFNGVAQIVSRLFDIVQPVRAYFGQKDFQQLAVIRALVKKMDYPIDIVACPTVREADGLAMSSRNMLLDSELRQRAAVIPATLQKACELRSQLPVDDLKQWVIAAVNANEPLEVEYFEIVDSETLQPVSSWFQAPEIVGCIAVFAGKVRLIDNVVLTGPAFPN